MPVASELMVKVGFDGSEADRGLDQTGRKIEGFGHAAGALGTAATAAFLGVGAAAVGLGAGLASAVTSAADFEAVISEVGAVSGASGAELAGLSQLALQMGADTAFSASEAAQAMAELAKGGIEVADMAAVLPATLDLAAAGGLGLAEAATIATDTLSIFATQGVSMEQVANAFAGAANISSISVQDMAESMKYIGPVASSLGISLEDTAAAVALLGANGLKGSQAGTGLRTMLVSLASPSKEAKKLMGDLGLEFFDASGKMKDFAGISDELKEALKGMTDQQRAATLETLFGREGMSAAIAMLGEGENSIQSYTDKLRNAATAHQTGAAMLDNFNGSMEQLKGSVETAAITLGLAFLPVLRQVVDAATRAVNAAVPFIKAWGPRLAAALQAGIGQAVAIVRSFGTAIAATVNSLRTGDFSNLFGPLVTAVSTAFGPETAGRMTTFLSNLVTGLNTARDAVLTAKQAFAGDWVNSGAIAGPVALVGDIFTRLGEAVRTVQGWIAQIPAPVLQAAAAFLSLGPVLSVASALFLPLLGALTGLGPIISVLTSTIPLLGTVIAALGGPLTLLIAAVVGLGLAWTQNWFGIQTATMPIITAIGAMITGTLLPALTQIGTFLTTTVLPAFVQGWAQIQLAISTAMALIMPVVQQFVGFLTGSLLPGIQGIVAVAVPAFQQMGAAVMGAIQAALPGIQAFASGIQQWTAAALPVIQQVAKAIISDLGPAVMAIVGWAQTVIPQFAAAFENVMRIVGPIIGALASLIGTALSTIADYINSHSEQITTVMTAAWDIISGVVSAAFAIITGVISAGLQAIAGDWSGVWNTIRDTAASVWASIQQIVGAAITIVVTAITTGLASARTVALAAWEAIKTAAQSAWDGIKTLVVAAITTVQTAITTGLNTARTFAVTAFNGIVTAATTGMAQLVTAVATGISRAIALIASLPGRAVAAVGNLGSVLFSAGASLVQGFINGINSKIGEAIAAAGKLAGLISGGIGDALGIKSPSRVTMEFGRQVVIGLALGMARHADEAGAVARDLGGRAITSIVDGMDAEAADLQKKLAETVSAVAKATQDALDALDALADFRGGPAGEQVSRFMASLGDFLEKFTTAAGEWEEDVLESAKRFAAGAGAAVGMIKGGVEGLMALDDFRAPLEASVSYFMRSLGDFLEKFTTAAGEWEEDVLASASRFATAARDAVGVLSGAVSGLMALADFEAPLETTVSLFLRSLGDFMERFTTAAGEWEADVLESASRFATAARDATGLLGGAVAGLAALADFEAPIEATISRFLASLGDFLERFTTAAGEWEADVLESAKVFADGAGAAVGMIGGAVEGLSKLADFVAPSQQAIDNFVYAVYAAVRKIAEMASQMSEEGIATAGAFGDAAGSVFSALKDALDIFTKLSDLVVPSAQAIDNFGIAVAYTVRRLGGFADEIGKDGIAQAAKFGDSVGAIFGTLKSAMDILTNLEKFKDVAAEAFDSLLVGMQAAIERAQGMVSASKNLVLESEEYLANMTKAAANFAKGMSLGGGGTPEEIGRSLGEGIASGARDALDSHSPSQVMAQIGRDVVAGLVEGMDEAQQDAAKKAAEVASAIAGAVSAGVAAFTALGSFTAPGAGPIRAFAETLTLAINDLAVVSETIAADMLDEAAKFGEIAQKAVALYGSGVSAFTGLRGYVRPAKEAIYDFGKDLLLAIPDLAAAAETIGAEITAIASGFGEAVGKATGGIANAVGGFVALKDYVRPAKQAIYDFGKDLLLLVPDFAAIVDLIGVEMAQKAGDLGETLGKITGGIAGAVEGLAALRGYTRPAAGEIAAFAASLEELMARMVAVAVRFESQGLDAAGRLSDAVKSVLGSIGPAVSGLKDLLEFISPPESAMDAFAASVRAMIARMVVVAGTLATDGVTAAAALGEGFSKVFQGLSAATGFFKSLDDILLPDQGGIDRILAPILATVAAVAAAARQFDPATLAAAGALADIVGKVSAAVQGGGRALVPAGGGGGGGTTHIYTFNISGPVYGFDQFEDEVVSALEDARRRGRIT